MIYIERVKKNANGKTHWHSLHKQVNPKLCRRVQFFLTILIVLTFTSLVTLVSASTTSNAFVKEAHEHILKCSTAEARKVVSSLSNKYTPYTVDLTLQYIRNIENTLSKAKRYYNSKNYETAYNIYKSLASVCKNSETVIKTTIDLAIQLKKYDEAIHLVSDIQRLPVKNNEAVVKSIIYLYSRLGRLDRVLSLISNYMILDPDNTYFIDRYKTIKLINDHIKTVKECYTHKNNKDYDSTTCLKTLDELKKSQIFNYIESNELLSVKALINTFYCIISKSNENDKNSLRSLKNYCEAAFSLIVSDPKAISFSTVYKRDLYLTFANTLIGLKKYKRALEVAESGYKEFNGDSVFASLVKKCKTLFKNAPDDDYYTILGVPKNATTREITSAYRKLAKENHPDRKKEGPDREEAMEEMAKINKAKEVLVDPKKRSEYDNRNMYQGYHNDDIYYQNTHGHNIFYKTHDDPRYIINNNFNTGHSDGKFFIKFNPTSNHRVNDPISHIINNIFADIGF